LSSAVPPTYCVQLGANNKQLPAHLRKLHRDITRTGKRGVLSLCVKVRAAQDSVAAAADNVIHAQAELSPNLDEFDVDDNNLFSEGADEDVEERSLLREILLH
jgi:hypothetical protein